MQGALFKQRPIAFLEGCRRRYGDPFTIRIPGYVGVFTSDPAAVKQIFTGDPSLFCAGAANAGPLEPVLGHHSLLTLDGNEHMRQRKLMLPPFHGESVRRFGDLIEEIAVREVDRWPLGRRFALRPRMQAIALEVILRAIFGLREQQRLATFRTLLTRLSDRMGLVVQLPALRRDFGPLSPWSRFLRARAAVDEAIFEEISQRRAETEEDRDDVMSLLLAARHEDGTGMNDVEVRDQLVTLMLAGQDTTATGLAWAFERLLRHPRCLERLREELERGADAYMEAVLKETLRLRPPLVHVARVLKADVTVDGYVVPAGLYLVPSLALVHLRDDLYPEPHAFRPERFLEGQPEPYAWIPFGGGVRRCIGAAFAAFEMKTVLRTVLLRTRLEAPRPRSEPPRMRHVTAAPARGAVAILVQRSG